MGAQAGKARTAIAQALASVLVATGCSTARTGAGPAPGRLTKVMATDGVWLDAIGTGSGPRGVVLVPELGNEGKCGWCPYAAHLAATVMAFLRTVTGGMAGADHDPALLSG